jgi:hypothetical protein
MPHCASCFIQPQFVNLLLGAGEGARGPSEELDSVGRESVRMSGSRRIIHGFGLR